MLYTRTEKPTLNLVKLVTYLVKIYSPTWFLLKSSGNSKDTPEIIFKSIQMINELEFKDIAKIAQKNINGNSFCLLPENMLHAMVLSNNEETRLKGLNIILKLRNFKQFNVIQVVKKIPPVNWDANHWSNLIDFSDLSTLREPVGTLEFSLDQIQEFISNKTIPNIAEFPSHTQSVERAVKMVTEASTIVYGFDNRHRTILTKILSRKLRPNFASKCSYNEQYDSYI